MSSVLSSLFSRDPKSAFAYELPVDSSSSFTNIQQDIFVGKSFKKSDPAEKATCFWSSSPGSSLKTQAQKLKTLRHPNVLTFLDSIEADNTFYLLTEPCRPLDYYLGQTKLNDTQLELLVSWGLYQILNCLKFLHNEAKISQNNLKNAIFVTDSGDWKLAAFHLTSTFSTAQTDLNDLASVLSRIFQRDHSTSSVQHLPKRLQPLHRRLSARGRSILAVPDILNECRSVGGFMKNKFVDTLLFLDEFQLRDATEKQSFFMQLNSNLDLFPDDISRNKILPKLIHTYEYGDAGAHILVPMFKLGRLLEEDAYQQRVVPCLVKLFSSTDRTTRVKLLERIDEFAGHLRPQVVNDKIYGNLVTGFMDSNSAVRESTVKAMVSFADKLNYHNLNTDLMKYLARLQGSDPEPSIRTNSTICLGKIGCYIDPSHRQRILISAFTRALKDPFPPARMAGVIALSATQQYYSLAEVAQRVLPALVPLAVDPEKQVRDQSFKAMNGFLEKLQKASENPELIPELEAQVKAGGKGGLLSGEKVPQWAGWAIKAISGKFYKSTAPTQQQGAGAVPATQQQQSESATATAAEVSASSKKEHPAAVAALPRMGSFSSSHSSAKGTSSSVTDGWGELVDEEEEDEGGGGGGRNRGEVEEDDGSDYGDGGKLKAREDALWGAAMDEWEGREAATPSPVVHGKLNPPFSLGSSATTPERKPSPPVVISKPTTTTTTSVKGSSTALKLGAIKRPPLKMGNNNKDPLDLLMELNMGELSDGGGGGQKKVVDAGMANPKKSQQETQKKVANFGGNSSGNFVAHQRMMAQQQKKGEEGEGEKNRKKKEENDWQSW